jgi:sugar O-acyltransferase (sialic acid O-acetyltransferase NeuD family)
VTRATLHVLGAGGHAKVVIATARAAGYTSIEVHDDSDDRQGTMLLGIPVTGGLGAILEAPDALAVLAIGDNATRARLAGTARCRFESLVHPSAHVESSAVLGPGVVVFAGVVIQPDCRLGDHTIVNTGATIDHDCLLGRAVHVAPGCHLAGNVTLGEGAFLGIGTVVIPGRTIGEWAVVGAGAAVIHDLPSRALAVGVPARPRQ